MTAPRVVKVDVAREPVEVMREDKNGVLLPASVTVGRGLRAWTYRSPRFRSSWEARKFLDANGSADVAYVLVSYQA